MVEVDKMPPESVAAIREFGAAGLYRTRQNVPEPGYDHEVVRIADDLCPRERRLLDEVVGVR